VAALVLAEGPAAALTNGDFSAGLDAWTTTGAVIVDSEELVLADDGPASSGAWQVVAAESSRARLEFDVLGTPSSFTPSDPFGFPDIFAASLFLFDEPAGFDPVAGTALSATSVLSIDSDGPYDVFADVAPAARGGGWQHVSIEFDTPHAYFAPAFELFELALVGGDSRVRIDDVTVTSLPEPGTGVFLLLGLSAALCGRWGLPRL
jgi:hypothetical protein